MIPSEIFAVLLVLALCAPILIMLIHLQTNDNRLQALERDNADLRVDLARYMGIVIEKDLRGFLEAELLPTEEEVSGKHG